MASKATAPATAPDFSEHERTYRGFLRLSKWAIVGLAILLVVLYFVVKP